MAAPYVMTFRTRPFSLVSVNRSTFLPAAAPKEDLVTEAAGMAPVRIVSADRTPAPSGGKGVSRPGGTRPLTRRMVAFLRLYAGPRVPRTRLESGPRTMRALFVFSCLATALV